MNTATRLNLQHAMQHAAGLEDIGQVTAANDVYRQILAIAPGYHPAYHALATLAYQSGDLALTAELTAKASALDSKVGIYHRNLCELYRLLGQLDKAVAHGLRAVKLEPTVAAGHSNLGLAYYDLGKLDRAETSIRRALTLDPDYAIALNIMGSISKERGDVAQAMAYYRLALKADAYYAEAMSNLGALLVLESRYDEALTVLKGALELAPNQFHTYCSLGFVLNGMEQFAEAYSYFQAALQLYPDCSEAYLGLAKFYQELQNLPQAEIAARQGVALAPHKADAHSILGAVLAESGAIQQAAESFDTALALDPTQHGALLGKGNLCMEIGDLQAAEALLTRVLQQETPNRQIAARCYLAQIKKVRVDDPNLAALQAATELQGLPAREQRHVHFALGKCYDDIGQYDSAMSHFMRGCALKRATLNYDRAAQALIVGNTIDIFSKQNIRRWQGKGNDSALPVFVLGMPRSGTTLIEQIIASHPQVFGAGELHDLSAMVNRPMNGASGFPLCMRDMDPEQIGAWGEHYAAGLRSRDPAARRIIDKTPSNFFAVGLIHVMLPNARIIHVRRNPVDTCLSCFTHLFNHGQEYSYDLGELGEYYAGYARLMQHWREVLPAGAFMEVDYEDVVADMATQARRMLDFCGLEWDAACQDFHMNKRSVRTASVVQVRQPIYNSSVGRWRKYQAHLAPLLQALGDLAR